MLIICPSCGTSYDVDAASLRPSGRQVRCVRCRSVWQAQSQADKLLAAAEALGPTRASAASAPSQEKDGFAWVDGSTTVAPGNRQTDSQQVAGGAGGNAEASAGPDGQAFAAVPNAAGGIQSPPIASVDVDQTRSPIEIDAKRQDIETVAARRRRQKAKRRTVRWPTSRLQIVMLALIIVDSALVLWRSDLVRALPQTASLYASIGLPVNLRGLAFEGITTTAEQHEGVPILVVDGSIVNDAAKFVDVPRLKFIVRNAARHEIYSWTAVPSRAVLPPGEAVSFHTRLASPPPEAHDLQVRLLNPRDIIRGVR